MQYVEEGDVVDIHDQIIHATGGRTGIHSRMLLGSAIERPKLSTLGYHRYRSVYAKAAVLLDSIANHHVFNDGNKRTAVAAAAYFLQINGYRLVITDKQYESYILRVVSKKPSIRSIARWLRKHSEEIA